MAYDLAATPDVVEVALGASIGRNSYDAYQEEWRRYYAPAFALGFAWSFANHWRAGGEIGYRYTVYNGETVDRDRRPRAHTAEAQANISLLLGNWMAVEHGPRIGLGLASYSEAFASSPSSSAQYAGAFLELSYRAAMSLSKRIALTAAIDGRLNGTWGTRAFLGYNAAAMLGMRLYW